MTTAITITRLGDSPDADRILDEFEQRTGLEGEAQADGRSYEMHDELHRTKVIGTLTDIDAGWTEHLGFKDPG